MKIIFLILKILILSIVLMRCTWEPSVTFTIKIDSTERDLVTEIHDTLLRRYNESLPSRFSKIFAKIDDSLIVFDIRNGSPSKQVITYLTETPGLLEAFHFDNRGKHLWFTDQDLISATVVTEKELLMLNIKIASEAAMRTARLSTRNIGQKLAIEIDRYTVAEAIITETLSSSFLVPLPNTYYAHEISAVLTFGRLPVSVKLVRWGQED